MRFGHLNFKDLFRLNQGTMVNGLPQVNIPETVGKDCVQCKQTRGNFQKFVPQKTKAGCCVFRRMWPNAS